MKCMDFIQRFYQSIRVWIAKKIISSARTKELEHTFRHWKESLTEEVNVNESSVGTSGGTDEIECLIEAIKKQNYSLYKFVA